MKIPTLLILTTALFLAACTAEKAAPNNDAPAVKLPDGLISDADAVKNALKVGAQMPSFALKDIDGKDVGSDELMKKGNLVLIFYRGAWCPFCNTYLQELQRNAAAIQDAGGEIVAISVESPDGSTTVAQKNELKFTVLSDPNLETARKFGIVYQLPAETDKTFKSRGLDVAIHNQMEKAELPLGATFIVNQQGEITYAYLDTDYKKRAEPEVIIENLNKIRNTAQK